MMATAQTQSLLVTTDQPDIERTVVLAGDLDISNIAEIRDQLLAASGTTVVADLAGVTFIDSSVLATLIHVQGVLRTDGRELAVVNRPPVVERLLELTGLVQAFDPPD
jgi:anti-anti-sigma factor